MNFPTFDDFRRQTGKPYEVQIQGGQVSMKLAAAQELPTMGRQGGSFRLEFLGPLQPILAQGTYPFSGAGQRHDIFIVPIAQDQLGTRYEAIFV